MVRWPRFERRPVSLGGVMRARSAVLVISLIFALAACGGDAGSVEEAGSADKKRAAEGSGGGAAKSGKTVARSADGEPTRSGPPETTGASGEGTSAEDEASQEGDERAGPPNTLLAGASDGTDGVLTDHRMVSYYGHPLSGAMGVLGQLEPEAMVRELKAQARAYTRLDPDLPAKPAIELIASVAQPVPGPDGLYLTRTEPRLIEKYSRLAEENDCLLLLDIQIGYSTIADEVEVLRPYLEREHVHLAIDTEYDMIPPDIPAQQIGSSPGADIMGAARTLSEIVRENDLPPKVLVVHQFQSGMIQNKQMLRPVPNVEFVLHADGFGTPRQKIVKYNALVRDEPIQYGGFKLFYDQDAPLLSPRETLKVLEPNPAVISYQ